MNNKNIILIVILVLVIVLAIFGAALGIMYYKNSKEINSNGKPAQSFNLTLEDMYCNIKDSKKIAKIKVTVETSNEQTLEYLTEKQFLIRDNINKIIRNKGEDQIEGKEGQNNLQKEIKESLVDLFDNNNITNIYFNDFVIQ